MVTSDEFPKYPQPPKQQPLLSVAKKRITFRTLNTDGKALNSPCIYSLNKKMFF
jgi:hypothetical protein